MIDGALHDHTFANIKRHLPDFSIEIKSRSNCICCYACASASLWIILCSRQLPAKRRKGDDTCSEISLI